MIHYSSQDTGSSCSTLDELHHHPNVSSWLTIPPLRKTSVVSPIRRAKAELNETHTATALSLPTAAIVDLICFTSPAGPHVPTAIPPPRARLFAADRSRVSSIRVERMASRLGRKVESVLFTRGEVVAFEGRVTARQETSAIAEGIAEREGRRTEELELQGEGRLAPSDAHQLVQELLVPFHAGKVPHRPAKWAGSAQRSLSGDMAGTHQTRVTFRVPTPLELARPTISSRMEAAKVMPLPPATSRTDCESAKSRKPAPASVESTLRTTSSQ